LHVISHFASLNFNLTGGSLPPVIPTKFYTEFEADTGALIVFDAYVANSDRHAGNLSADYSSHCFNVFDRIFLRGLTPHFLTLES
jgi:hypothetical protein